MLIADFGIGLVTVLSLFNKTHDGTNQVLGFLLSEQFISSKQICQKPQKFSI